MELATRRQGVRAQGPPEDAWNGMRNVIERLYRHENKTENEVRQILMQQYDFVVTSKMFKEHIRKWKLDKKRKRGEMIFALRKIKQRRESGKSTVAKIRGEEITEAQIHQYFKRRPLTTTELLESSDAPTPEDVEYTTPPNTPLQKFTIPSRQRNPSESVILPKSNQNCASGSDAETPDGQSPELQIVSTTGHRSPAWPLNRDLEVNQLRSFGYILTPCEDLVRQLHQHVQLSASGKLCKQERQSIFRSASILRAAGWFDTRLDRAITAEEDNKSSLAHQILSKCASLVAAEVDGYFPDMFVMEMMEIFHFLRLRGRQRLLMDFMYSLYDDLCSRVGRFHPLVELLCSTARGYTCEMSANLIPLLLEFLQQNPSPETPLNLLLPLFAFQELRTIDSMPYEVLVHALPQYTAICDTCKAAIRSSPFVGHDFRLWAARYFINLLIDIWSEPCEEQSRMWHSTLRSRVWRYAWKYDPLGKKRESLLRMTLKDRFWAVAKLCFDLTVHNIQRIFFNPHPELSAQLYIDDLTMASARKTALLENEIEPLWLEEPKPSFLDIAIHESGKCEHDICGAVTKCLRYWIGNQLCCV